MRNLVNTAFLAFSLAAAGLAATAPAASASEVGFSLTIESGSRYSGHDRWRGSRHRGHDRWRGSRHRGHDRWRDNRRWHGWHGGHRRGFCAPEQALEKARWMGIRHARIVGVDRRTVVMRGRKHGHRVRAVFANTWNCPVVAMR